MAERGEGDEFRSYWVKYPLERLFVDASPDEPPVTVELRMGDEPMVVETADGRILAHPGLAEHADAVVTGEPDVVIQLLGGVIDMRAAKRAGLRVDGDAKALARVKPRD
jgi:hypothetical protein